MTIKAFMVEYGDNSNGYAYTLGIDTEALNEMLGYDKEDMYAQDVEWELRNKYDKYLSNNKTSKCIYQYVISKSGNRLRLKVVF